ncbi:MAG TPA: HEAT repeat domain-containing protein [Verrucomicrobiae bacterium]|nr:HEAT repeat domain-containing protein [Verrucomicrobiae bacterium]
MKQFGRVFVVCFLLAVAPSCLPGEIPPALDARDEQAMEMALRGIRMTPQDLSFQKTNVESELILQKARTFLQQPLTLPVYGQSVASHLQSISSLAGLADFSRREVEVPMTIIDMEYLPVRVDPGFLSNLPPTMARAVGIIADAAGEAGQLLRQSLPREQMPLFAAFAVPNLGLDKDPAELQAWAKLGLSTNEVADLLRRNDDLDIQDGELENTILNASDQLNRPGLFEAFRELADSVDKAIAILQAAKDDPAMQREFQMETDTPLGKIIVGGGGHHVYTNEAFLIIDTGGTNTYLNSAGGANGLLGRPISIVIDRGDNDDFISNRSFSQGSGVFGIGILAALGSNCTFHAKHLSQGAGFFGAGLLMTGGGNHTFEGDTFCQGAGMFGAGIVWQRGGGSRYKAVELAQGFGGTSGIGLLLDEGGNDFYNAGGKYPCGWLPKHYFSLSQGFGYGMRPFAGGGIGILCDLKGNNHYVADVYGQGASYWYSTGLLLDLGSNNTYDAYQYCQGAGIHLSSGELIDWGGNDTYTAGHICQGAAHDYAVGILIDRGGTNKFSGETTAQGAAINNSFAMLLNCAGNDSYTGGTDPKSSQAAGHDGDKREYGSIALMVDGGGRDTYSQGQTNGTMWLKPLYGCGVNLDDRVPTGPLPAMPTAMPEFGASKETSGRLYPLVSVDTHNPVERLLRRWVSDRPDADAAGRELEKRGAEILPYLLTRVDSPDVLVRVKTEEVIDHLGTNAIPSLMAGIDHAKNDEMARMCCYFLARFNEKARAAIPHVLPLIQRPKTRTTAFYTLGHLRAHEAFAPAMAALGSPQELVRLRATQALGRIGDRRATVKLIGMLNDELWDVRYAAEDGLVAFGRGSIGPLRKAYENASARARPHILEALAQLGDDKALAWARTFYEHDDPQLRTAVEKQLTDEYAATRKKR